MQSTPRINIWTTVIFNIGKYLQNASNLLNTIMFPDDTNLFFERKDISVLFLTVNRKFQNIKEWFISNKLSLNV